MAGGNPFMPPGASTPSPMPGANPGGPVGQGPGAANGSPSRQNNGLGRGPGATIMAPAPPAQPPSGQSGPPPASKAGQPFADIHQNLKYTQARFNDGQKAQQVLDHVRVELDKLMEMGDVVRPEHVIEAAGRLVGHGLGATQLAQIMSDMPSMGGEGLASWVRMHDLIITNAEQQLARENAVVGHQLAVAGIKSIAASHLEQEAIQGPKPPIINQLGAGQPGVEGGVPEAQGMAGNGMGEA